MAKARRQAQVFSPEVSRGVSARTSGLWVRKGNPVQILPLFLWCQWMISGNCRVACVAYRAGVAVYHSLDGGSAVTGREWAHKELETEMQAGAQAWCGQPESSVRAA